MARAVAGVAEGCMPSFGEELRRARELRKITLREISEATKISLRYLQALERNDFEHLPGGVFNKGFVRAYCEFIGVDTEAMVDAYLFEERTQAGQDSVPQARPAPRRSASEQPPVASAKRARVRWAWVGLVLAVLGLLIGLLVFFGFAGDSLGQDPRPGPSRITARDDLGE